MLNGEGKLIVDPTEKLRYLIRAAVVSRILMREIAATVAVMYCVIIASIGVLMEHAIFWINVLPAVFFLVTFPSMYPSRDEILETYRKKIAGRL